MKRRLAALLGTAQGAVLGGLAMLIWAPFMPSTTGIILSLIFGVMYIAIGGSIWWSINKWKWTI